LDRPRALLVGTVWHYLNGIAFAVVYAKVTVQVDG